MTSFVDAEIVPAKGEWFKRSSLDEFKKAHPDDWEWHVKTLPAVWLDVGEFRLYRRRGADWRETVIWRRVNR